MPWPSNPPPSHDAEAEYKKARTPDEKLAALKKMWVILPKHKASEKVQAILKTKISEVTDEVEAVKSGPKKATASYKIPHQGAGTIVFLGGPNAGKSSLLRKLTKATPEVAPYPFTTREPVPGMMDWEDVRVQLIDLPPITADFYEPHITDFARTSHGAALIVDIGDDGRPPCRKRSSRRLAGRSISSVIKEGEGARQSSHPHAAHGKQDRRRRLNDRLDNEGDDRRPCDPEPQHRERRLDELRTRFFRMLGVIRIYAKPPGKPADMTAPFTIHNGGTVLDFAERVHSDLSESLKSAKVWGSAQFDGQTVKRDHVLRDRDVVELHM